MAGLVASNSNLRLVPPEPEPKVYEPQTITIEETDEDQDQPEFDAKGNVIKITHPDGSITINLDGSPISSPENKGPEGWFDNLADDIDTIELSRISDELIRGIDADKESRRDWLETRAEGIRLLGFKIELPGTQGGSDSAPVEGMSRVRHPLLQEAVLRFQANASAEMLPVDGPVKVRIATNRSTTMDDDLADALEADMNKYLTSVATEYYPDTDRMFLMQGFGGTAFKKVYKCPLRNRPVSETVDAEDLIVSNTATDLVNAQRVTHRIRMSPSTVRRMQIVGAYRDITLPDPMIVEVDPAKEEREEQQGVKPEQTLNPDDRDREIYECYCELDIPGYEHEFKGKISGLKIPYRVTIDVSSRDVLAVIRDFNEPEDGELPTKRRTFVKYPFVPGLGFYDIGLLHILGNTTNALTAAWREMLDAGMFASFPGFLIASSGTRQKTNILRVPPGAGAQIDTNGQKIGDAVMPLPYKDASPGLVSLVQDMSQTGARIGGTAEIMVGEGRQDAPVGTTIAMIEQAVKVLNSVHKRMHRAQGEEFQLLKECFRENPETFMLMLKKFLTHPWTKEEFLQALENYDLVPQADPNTASHIQRVMKVVGLKQLQASNPTGYDPVAVDTEALKALGWSNPEQFLIPPTGTPTPDQQKDIAAAASAAKTADARMLDAQTHAAETQAKVQAGAFAPDGGDNPADQSAELQIKAQDAATKAQQVQFQQQRAGIEDQNRDKDREADLAIAELDFKKDQLAQHADHSHDMAKHATGLISSHILEAQKQAAPKPAAAKKTIGRPKGAKNKPKEKN